jgi:DNA-binding transcriptional LysR family regulator
MRLAALRGVGVAQLPAFVVDEDIAAATLVEIIREWTPRTGVIHAIFPSRRGLLPAVRGLLDFLAKEFSGAPRVGRVSGEA